MDYTTTLVLVCLALALGYGVNDIRKSVRKISNRQARLSYTFVKLENDINHLQDSILLLSSVDPELIAKVQKLKDRRPSILAHLMKVDFSEDQILRGLEAPDIEDDPKFYSLKG